MITTYTYSGVLACALLFLLSCGDKQTSKKKPIVMGDSSSIVMETDSKYLENYTEDIAPNNHKSSAKKIAQMMVQVDSLHAKKKLDESVEKNLPVSGLTCSFEDFDVIFNNLAAHPVQSGTPTNKASSVSYIKDGGSFQEMKVQLKNIQDATIEEKLVTKLTAEINQERFVLQSLGTYSSPWYNLAGNNNLFLSTGNNSIQFNETNSAKLKQALTAAMQNKRKSSAAIQEAIKQMKPTTSVIDPPFKIEIYSVQYIVKGTVNGKKVKKLIRFDIPL